MLHQLIIEKDTNLALLLKDNPLREPGLDGG